MAEVPKSIRASLYIDGKPAEASLKNINQVTRTLRRELDGLVVGTDAWNAKMKELQLHERTLQNIKNEIKGVGGAFGWLKTEVGKLGTLAVGYLGLQFVTSQFQNIILSNARLSDSLADVRRTVGLTENEVMQLNKSFKELDTRTSVEQLRNIAMIAGRLGVAKNEVLGFVEATDKLVVTLGDELGDADQITTQLGKILNVYEGSVNGDNISKLGNAMIVMANAGVASGGFLADFTQRVSGIAKTANLSLGATLGLGAALEELGGRAESSSTAVTRLLTDIASDIPKAARIAQVPLAEFNKMFADTPEKALLAYAKGLVANKTAFSEVSMSLKDAGEEGARVISTLTALGNKAEFAQEKIDLGNKSLLETSAINEGFTLKNETFGGTVDKLGKKFSELSANKGLIGFLQSLVFATSAAIDAFNNHALAISRLIKFLVAGGVAWLTYSTYVNLAKTTTFSFITAMIKGESVMAISRTGTIALAGAKALLSGNMTKAAQAARLLNLTLAANPIGAMLAALAATITMIILFKDKTNDAAKAQETLNKIHAAAQDQIAEQKDRIQELNKIMTDQNQKYTDRLAAMTALRQIIPGHLKAYSDEQLLANGAASAINDYVRSLERRAEAEAAFEELKQLKKEEREIRRNGGELGFGNGVEVVLTDIFLGGEAGDKVVNKRVQENYKNALRTNKMQQDAITSKYKSDLQQQTIEGGNINDGGLSQPLAADGTVGARKAALQKQIKDLEAAYELLNETDKKGMASNRTLRAQLQKQLDALSGTGDKKLAKEAETEAKKRVKEFESLSNEHKALNVSLLQDQLSKNAKEVAQEENKYNKLSDKLVAFINKKGVTEAQKAEAITQIGEIELQKQDSVNAIKLRQEKEMADKIHQLRVDLGVLNESELDKEKARINKFYDELARDNTGNADVLAKIKTDRARDLTQAELNEAKRLQQEKERIEGGSDLAGANRFNKQVARINKKYDDEIAALKKKFSKEIQLTKEFQDTIDQINKNRDAEIEVAEEDKWRAIKDLAVEATQSLSDAVFSIGANNRKAESDAKIRKLEEERDKELSNKNLTEKQKDAINKKYDKQVKEEKLRAWEADKNASVTQSIINTALAVTKALPNIPLSIAAGIAGAAQTAVIISQKPPEFATGGFSDSDPAGYVGQATIFKQSASGRPFMAGEKGKEWIAPNWMLQNPRTASIISMLEVARREKRAFASGGFSDNSAGTQMFSFNNAAMNEQNRLIKQQMELIKKMGDEFQRVADRPNIIDFNTRVEDKYRDRISEMNRRAEA